MKRIVLVTAALFAGSVAGAAPSLAEPSWQPWQQEPASAMRQLPVVPVRGRGHRGWGWESFGSPLIFPPARAALVLRSFVPVPPQSHSGGVWLGPAPPYAAELSPPAIASPSPGPAVPNMAPTGRSSPWVDPDEPAR